MSRIVIFIFLLLLPLGFIQAQLPGECDYTNDYPNNISTWHDFWTRLVLATDGYIYERNDTTDINFCYSLKNWGAFPVEVNFDLVVEVYDSSNSLVASYTYDGPDTVLSFGLGLTQQWSFDSTANWQPGTYQTHAYVADWPDDELVLEFVVEDEIPVELVSFSASFTGREVILEWQTASELNNSGWYIERSGDKVLWERLAWVSGGGTTTLPQNYSYHDSFDSFIQGQQQELYYRLLQIDWNGAGQYSPVIKVQAIPASFSLSQNYPNPFNGQTRISYLLSKGCHITLEVYNILGNRIAVLVNSLQPAGVYNVFFKADGLSSGIYFYVLKAGGEDYVNVKKMTLTK